MPHPIIIGAALVAIGVALGRSKSSKKSNNVERRPQKKRQHGCDVECGCITTQTWDGSHWVCDYCQMQQYS
jgi:Tick salivary peptide group 1